jgi:hypothetical protein
MGVNILSQGINAAPAVGVDPQPSWVAVRRPSSPPPRLPVGLVLQYL